MLRGGRHYLEVALESGKVLRSVDVSNELAGCEYVQNEVLCMRQQWLGGLWMADRPF